jgi:hypothetical protein
MRMRLGTIKDYLTYVTSIELVDVDDPLADMSIYDTAIDAMAAAARREGKLGDLQLALDSLISDPAGRIAAFYGMGYPFTTEQLVAVLTHACERIWPGQPVSQPGEAMPVEFVAVSRDEWARESGTT